MEREKPTPIEDLWTWKEVSKFLRIGRNSVYDMAANGDLPSVRIGGSRIRFIPAEIVAWVARQRGASAVVLPLSGRLAKSASLRKGEVE